jgi:hypothetical protein
VSILSETEQLRCIELVTEWVIQKWIEKGKSVDYRIGYQAVLEKFRRLLNGGDGSGLIKQQDKDTYTQVGCHPISHPVV